MYININGQNIYYQKTGKGNNLVLLHGWKQDVSTFWPVIDLLKDEFTLWLIDLPGFGRSELPEQTWSISEYAKLVAGFIEKLKIHKPIVLGHSFGGRVAIKLAANHPKVLHLLILEDSAGIKPPQGLAQTIYYLTAKIIKFLIPNIFNLKDKTRNKLYRAIDSDYGDAGKLKDLLTKTLYEDLTPDLSKIETETLLLWGENDKAVPLKFGKKMYRLIKNSRIEVFEGLGHFPHLENPNLFSYYVKDFS